jgi:uncharacterized membrane protein
MFPMRAMSFISPVSQQPFPIPHSLVCRREGVGVRIFSSKAATNYAVPVGRQDLNLTEAFTAPDPFESVPDIGKVLLDSSVSSSSPVPAAPKVQSAEFSETAARSAVKALLWRVIAGSVTFFTSLRFSGSLTIALSIVGSDFMSKAATMFIGERLMNKSQVGRKSGNDDTQRSLAKVLIWRLFAIVNTLTMAIFISKDMSMASKIAGSDAFFKTGLMFVYERAWARIQWGKQEHENGYTTRIPRKVAFTSSLVR